MRATSRSLITLVVVITATAVTAFVWLRYAPRHVTVSAGAFPEELVYARSSDDIINGGVMFKPPKSVAKPIAIIWVHGWGVNFYSPTYVNIGRALAERRFTTISVNTRMHDVGTSARLQRGRRVRGGGYWGITSEETRDLTAWVDFAESQGFARVLLVGHSAGWGAVRAYESETGDSRVVGVVSASGDVRGNPRHGPEADRTSEGNGRSGSRR